MADNVERCRCGYEEHDKIVMPKATHSLWGWFLNCVGISTCPVKIEFTCPICGHIFKTETDPEICGKYRFRV